MKRKFLYLFLAVICVATVTVTACNGGKTATTTEPTTTARTTTATTAPTIKPTTTTTAVTKYGMNTTVSPAGGGIISPEGGTYDKGTEIELTAIPSSGYAFDYWSGDVTGTSSTINIVVDSNKSVTAHFKEIYLSDDGRIGFILSSIERTQIWPEEISGGRLPKAGHDFVIINVSIALIKEGHIDISRGSTIIGTDGYQYDEVAFIWTGIQFNDPEDLSATELAEGATGKIVFELPVSVGAVSLELAYEYFEAWGESWEKISPETRYMDIGLQ